MPVFYPIIEKNADDPVLQEKTATENGEVTADEGYDGLAKVTVDVPTGGGNGDVIVFEWDGQPTGVSVGEGSELMYLISDKAYTAEELATFSFYDAFGNVVEANIEDYYGVCVNVQAVDTSGNMCGMMVVPLDNELGFAGGVYSNNNNGAYFSKVTQPDEKTVKIRALENTINRIIDRTINEIESDVTDIHRHAFAYCTQLASAKFPKATIIGFHAFLDCFLLKEFNFPVVETIKSYAFSDTRFTEFVFPETLDMLYDYAFMGNINLATVTFKGTPTTIEQSAFIGCDALTTINVPWAEGAVANAPWGATNATINYNYTAE